LYGVVVEFPSYKGNHSFNAWNAGLADCDGGGKGRTNQEDDFLAALLQRPRKSFEQSWTVIEI
jgi:hypothetical protein